jgi:type VI secretion system secreted protein Hcp
MPNPLAHIYLKLDGIDGESTAKNHKKEIDVFSYEQGIDQTVFHSGGGGGSIAVDRAKLSPVRFRKNVDVASIPMLLTCAQGKLIKDAVFTFTRGAAAFEFYKVTLNHVLITHMFQRAGTGEQYPLTFTALDAGDTDNGFLDEVTLDYRQIRWEYRTQRPSGAPGTTVKGGWDVNANKKL